MKLFVAAAALAAVIATPAMAREADQYVQFNLGGTVGGEFETSDEYGVNNSLSGDTQTGAFASVAFGRQLAPKWTLEGEVVYTSADLEEPTYGRMMLAQSTDINSTFYGALLNVQYEAYRTDKTVYYVGAGAGLGYHVVEERYHSVTYRGEDSGLMWQVKAGATRAITDKVSVDVAYRYLAAPEAAFGDGEVNRDAHVLSAGVRYNF